MPSPSQGAAHPAESNGSSSRQEAASQPSPLCTPPPGGASAAPALPPGARVLIPPEQIQARVAGIAARISADYNGLDLLMAAVLEGARPFHQDLAARLTIPAAHDFLQASSYGASHASSGAVNLVRDLSQDIAGRHVLLVEDIVDTGHTAAFLLNALRARRPASLRLCSLLDKPSRRVQPVVLHYTGFTVGDAFVFGYGLDLAGAHRGLPCVASLESPQTIPNKSNRKCRL